MSAYIILRVKVVKIVLTIRNANKTNYYAIIQ